MSTINERVREAGDRLVRERKHQPEYHTINQERDDLYKKVGALL